MVTLQCAAKVDRGGWRICFDIVVVGFSLRTKYDLHMIWSDWPFQTHISPGKMTKKHNNIKATQARTARWPNKPTSPSRLQAEHSPVIDAEHEGSSAHDVGSHSAAHVHPGGKQASMRNGWFI